MRSAVGVEDGQTVFCVRLWVHTPNPEDNSIYPLVFGRTGGSSVDGAFN